MVGKGLTGIVVEVHNDYLSFLPCEERFKRDRSELTTQLIPLKGENARRFISCIFKRVEWNTATNSLFLLSSVNFTDSHYAS